MSEPSYLSRQRLRKIRRLQRNIVMGSEFKRSFHLPILIQQFLLEHKPNQPPHLARKLHDNLLKKSRTFIGPKTRYALVVRRRCRIKLIPHLVREVGDSQKILFAVHFHKFLRIRRSSDFPANITPPAHYKTCTITSNLVWITSTYDQHQHATAGK